MQPFKHLTGIAAPLIEDNVDTDIIFPARFLLITTRAGLGRYAFHDRRERADFVLNQTRYRDAKILIAGANFGCGSSREQAVWALMGFGIRCVIAPSFGEIFHANCLRNGVLPVALPEHAIKALADQPGELTVDLQICEIAADGLRVAFSIGKKARMALLNGWDETAMILNMHGGDVAAFETRQRAAQPWLYEMAGA